VPTSVVTGLFLYMGVESLLDGDIFARLVFPFVQKHRWYLLDFDESLKKDDFLKTHRTSMNVYTVIQLLAFGIVFYVTQTVAAIAFPVFILLLVPLRFNVLPRFKNYFGKEFIDVMDQPLIADKHPEAEHPEAELHAVVSETSLGTGRQEIPSETSPQAFSVPSVPALAAPPVPDLVKAFQSPPNPPASHHAAA
jgi:hypothetical protein